MPLVTTKKMFQMAYKNGYAVGAFNVNNMEITQGIVEAVAEEKAPLILQISKGAREYARNSYLKAHHQCGGEGKSGYSDCDRTSTTATRSRPASSSSMTGLRR